MINPEDIPDPNIRKWYVEGYLNKPSIWTPRDQTHASLLAGGENIESHAAEARTTVCELEKIIKPGWVCLEYGCGFGRILRLLAEKLGNQIKLIGIDFNAGMIALAKEYCKTEYCNNVLLKEMFPTECPDIPCQDHSVDFIYSQAVMLHQNIQQLKHIFSEFNRVLKLDGCMRHDFQSTSSAGKDLSRKALELGYPVYAYSMQDICSIANLYGFHVYRQRPEKDSEPRCSYLFTRVPRSSIDKDTLYSIIAEKRIARSIDLLSDSCFEGCKILDIGGTELTKKKIFTNLNIPMEYKYINQEIDIRSDQIPHDDNSFDIVISWETIEHLWSIQVGGMLSWSGIENFWKESYRLLKKGGTFFITTPNRFCPRTFRTFCLGICPHVYPAENLHVGHAREFSARDLRNIVTSLGMFQKNRIFSENVYDNSYKVGAYDIDYESDEFLGWEQKMEKMIGRKLKPEEKGDTLFFIGNK